MQEIDESELSCLQENATRKGQLIENLEDDSLNSRDESIILEGPNADTSRITTIYQQDGEYVTEVMKYGVRNEISSFEREVEEQGVEKDVSDEESVQKRVQELEEFYDASDESFPDSEIESENKEKPEPRLRTRDGLEIPFNWDKKTSRQKKEANKRRRRQKIVEKNEETKKETKDNETGNMSKRFPVIDWENLEELTEIWGKKDSCRRSMQLIVLRISSPGVTLCNYKQLLLQRH